MHGQAYLRFGKKVTPSYIYNLAGPIQLVDSITHRGIHIADIVANSAAFILRNPSAPISKNWRPLIGSSIVDIIGPDYSPVDLDQENPLVNAMILRELVERSVKGDDLLDHIVEFIIEAKFVARYYALETAHDVI